MTIRYDELQQEVKIHWDSLSEEEQHQRIVQCDPTFDEWVLSSTKEGDIIEIDYENNTFEVVGHYTCGISTEAGQTEKDLAQWLTEDALPSTKDILAELRSINAKRDEAKAWLEGNNIEITEEAIQERIGDLRHNSE